MAETTNRPTPPSQPDAGHIPMTEELDSAKWTLPPIIPLLIALVVLGAIVAVTLWTVQPKAGAEAQMLQVGSVEQEGGGTVLVAAQVRVKNLDEKKTLWVRSINGKLDTGTEQLDDPAAAPMNFERYFKAYPALESYRSKPLEVETQVPTGGTEEGMVVFAFPVSKQVFDARKNFTVTLDLYDRSPVVIAEKPQTK
jgi:hypothetical protein